jgi:glutaredoxin-related protein
MGIKPTEVKVEGLAMFRKGKPVCPDCGVTMDKMELVIKMTTQKEPDHYIVWRCGCVPLEGNETEEDMS